jgi:hypothetical protein
LHLVTRLDTAGLYRAGKGRTNTGFGQTGTRQLQFVQQQALFIATGFKGVFCQFGTF